MPYPPASGGPPSKRRSRTAKRRSRFRQPGRDRTADVLIQIGRVAVPVFVVCQMISVGLALTVAQILAPLKSLRVVVPALLVNFVVVPLIALALVAFLPLPQGYAYGLIILGCAAGAPFLPKMVQAAKGDVGFAVGLMVLLMVATILYLPLVLPLLIPGVTIHPLAIAEPLVVLILVPLGIGLLVRARSAAVANRLVPYFARATSIALVVLFVAYLLAFLPDLLGPAGSWALAASLAFLLGAFGAGYLAGGPDAGTRKVVGLGTSLRYSSAAAAVAGVNFASDPEILVMVLIVVLVSLALLTVLGRALGRRSGPDTTRDGEGNGGGDRA